MITTTVNWTEKWKTNKVDHWIYVEGQRFMADTCWGVKSCFQVASDVIAMRLICLPLTFFRVRLLLGRKMFKTTLVQWQVEYHAAKTAG